VSQFGDSALRAATRHGHLHIAKWLVIAAGVDLRSEAAFRPPLISLYEEDPALVEACKNGHLDVAMWLVSSAASDVTERGHVRAHVSRCAKWCFFARLCTRITTTDATRGRVDDAEGRHSAAGSMLPGSPAGGAVARVVRGRECADGARYCAYVRLGACGDATVTVPLRVRLRLRITYVVGWQHSTTACFSGRTLVARQVAG
jgi:hypothetical protein